MPFDPSLGLSHYLPAADRYDRAQFRRCGRSGLKLPLISLGLWQNFGDDRPLANSRAILRRAFDLGITHFDLANNYGPPYGSAEINFGRIFAEDLRPYRDELVISTKAGYDMWAGPYGEWGSRKYLLGSLDQSLKRMRLEYVDIFYSHRVDPETPLEETMGALDTAVRQGKARYVGICSYGPRRTEEAAAILRELGTPLLIHQPSYSMMNRWIEEELLDVLEREGARRDRVLAARSGAADRPLPGRHPGRLAGSSWTAFLGGPDHRRRTSSTCGQTQRYRRTTRAVARSARDRLGAARRARHLGADRCLAASGNSSRTSLRSSGSSSIDERARRDRSVRGRRRDQHLEGVEHRLAAAPSGRGSCC